MLAIILLGGNDLVRANASSVKSPLLFLRFLEIYIFRFILSLKYFTFLFVIVRVCYYVNKVISKLY